MIDAEKAREEVEQWLDLRKVKPREREQKAEDIETLIEAVRYGEIAIQEDGTLLQELTEEVPGSTPTTSLTYKKRLNVALLRQEQKGVKATDSQGLMLSYLATLTGKPKGLLEKLAYQDYKLGTTIVGLFI